MRDLIFKMSTLKSVDTMMHEVILITEKIDLLRLQTQVKGKIKYYEMLTEYKDCLVESAITMKTLLDELEQDNISDEEIHSSLKDIFNILNTVDNDVDKIVSVLR